MTNLELADLEQIVSTVSRESDRLSGGRRRPALGPFQKAAFLLLRLVAFSIPIALALLLLGIFFLDWSGSMLALLLLLWVLLVAPVLLLVLVLLNLPLMVVAWRQRKLIASRGLLVSSFPEWQRRGRWVVVAVTAVAVALHFSVPAFARSGALILVLVLITFPFALLLLQSFLKLAERNLDLQREIGELRSVLEKKLEEARRRQLEQIELPHELAVRISDANTEILSNERLRAIGDSMRTPASQYSVSQSKAFRERLEGLEPALRLQILDRVQELAQNQRPDAARQHHDSGSWHWATGEAEVELVYEVVDKKQQVLVRDLRLPRPTGSGETQGGG